MASPSNIVVRHAWLAIAWFGIALLLYLSLTPQPPNIQREHGDKLGHMLAYGVLTYFWAQVLTATRQRLALALSFIVLGVILEFIQGSTGWRTFDYYDMLANTAGVVTGAMLAAWTPNVLALASRSKMGPH
jgi:VanZ family protein